MGYEMSAPLKTSAAWAKQLGVLVMDPDGWDRKNYEYSWSQELITEEEFNKRLAESTTLMRRVAAPGEKLVTFRTEGPGDEVPLVQMLEEMDFKPVWIEKLIDPVNNNWIMYKYTLSVPQDTEVKDLKEKMYALMNTNPDYVNLHRCAQTLQEGIEPNENWYGN